ncbi:U2-type spliceosomal complex subunit [Martiniozyma asiatica (nom. inval.)]|nr:U2-type spliceosomal complex subunit [Martiniozyma asiatica]
MFKKRTVKGKLQAKSRGADSNDDEAVVAKVVKPSSKPAKSIRKTLSTTKADPTVIFDTLSSSAEKAEQDRLEFIKEKNGAKEEETIKQNTVVDYQRDVCKDFLKNGYCGFGDTCKFLHVRDEFKVIDNENVKKDWQIKRKMF